MFKYILNTYFSISDCLPVFLDGARVLCYKGEFTNKINHFTTWMWQSHSLPIIERKNVFSWMPKDGVGMPPESHVIISIQVVKRRGNVKINWLCSDITLTNTKQSHHVHNLFSKFSLTNLKSSFIKYDFWHDRQNCDILMLSLVYDI